MLLKHFIGSLDRLINYLLFDFYLWLLSLIFDLKTLVKFHGEIAFFWELLPKNSFELPKNCFLEVRLDCKNY